MGSKGYSTGAHVVFKLTVHLVFVTKYRRKVITERVFEIMREAWSSVCQKLECELMEANFEPDHVHLLVAYPTKVSIASLVQRLKGLSSRRVRARTLPDVRAYLIAQGYADLGWPAGEAERLQVLRDMCTMGL